MQLIIFENKYYCYFKSQNLSSIQYLSSGVNLENSCRQKNLSKG